MSFTFEVNNRELAHRWASSFLYYHLKHLGTDLGNQLRYDEKASARLLSLYRLNATDEMEEMLREYVNAYFRDGGEV